MYQVHVVPDGALPQGVRRVLVERVAEDPLLILTETAAAEWRPVKRIDPQAWVDDDESVVLKEVVNGC